MVTLTGKAYYNPIAFIIGVYAVYRAKANGISQIMTDITSITMDKINTKYMYLVYAVISYIAVGFIKKMFKGSVMIQLGVVLIAYYIMGYQVAKFLDPPNGNGSSNTCPGCGQLGRYTPPSMNIVGGTGGSGTAFIIPRSLGTYTPDMAYSPYSNVYVN